MDPANVEGTVVKGGEATAMDVDEGANPAVATGKEDKAPQGDVSASEEEDDDEEEEEEEEALYVLLQTGERLKIPVSEIPRAGDMLGLLKAEGAPLDVWLTFAVEYMKQGRTEDFETVLVEGTSREAEQFFHDDPTGRLKMLNALAAHKISLEEGSGRGRSGDHLAEAVELIHRADMVDSRDSLTWVNKGVLSLVRGEDENALQNFDSALQVDRNNLLAKLGKGTVLFKKREFAGARDQFKRAIREHPGCKANVRVNLGLSYYMLGVESRAIECFERALEMDENEVNAHVALALIELGRATENNFDLQMSQRAMQRLRRAYELEPDNATVLNHMANHFFFRQGHEGRDYGRIERLASKAYRKTHVDAIKAESAYILGRNYHEQDNIIDAAQFYDRALEHWPSFALAQFARAQTLLFKSHADAKNKDKSEQTRAESLALLEKVLRNTEYKNDRDVNMFVAWYHIRMNRRTMAMNMLQHVTAENPDDTDAWLEQARVMQKEKSLTKRQRREALRAYTKAASGLRPVPAWIYTNVGELKYSLGDTKGALDAFRAGLNKANEDGDEVSPEDSITLRFNCARVLEDLGGFSEAEELYNKLHEELPLYTEPLLRLGAIAETHGYTSKAEGFYTKATETKTNPEEAWVRLGLLAQKRGDAKLAKVNFSKVKAARPGEKKRVDQYSKLSLANLAFDSAMALRKSKPDHFKEHLGFAKTWYIKILERNGSNVYAANGLANVMAVEGHSSDAKQIYERLREPDDVANPSVWINLGHVAMEDGRFETAVSLYQQCIKRFKLERDVTLLLNLANALICSDKFEEARSTLLRAIKVDPSDLRLRHNVAHLLLKHGVDVCENPEQRGLEGVLRAVAGFKDAVGLFEWLVATQPSKRRGGADANGAGASDGKTGKKARYLQPPRSPRGAPSEDNAKYFKLLEEVKSASKQSSDGDALEQRRPLEARAAKSDSYKQISLATDLLQRAKAILRNSGKYIQVEELKRGDTQRQMDKLASENEKLNERIANQQREEEEAKKREAEDRERRAKAMADKSREVAEEISFIKQKKTREKEERKSKRGKKGKGKRGKKKEEDDFIVEEQSSVDEDELNNLSESDEDNGDDRDFDPEEARRQKQEAKRRKRVAAQNGSEEDGDDDDDGDEDDEDNDGSSRAKKPKTKRRKISRGKKSSTNNDDDSDSDDEGEDAADADADADADGSASGSAAPTAPKVLADSDDEDELQF